jgi:hypothetical protein
LLDRQTQTKINFLFVETKNTFKTLKDYLGKAKMNLQEKVSFQSTSFPLRDDYYKNDRL